MYAVFHFLRVHWLLRLDTDEILNPKKADGSAGIDWKSRAYSTDTFCRFAFPIYILLCASIGLLPYFRATQLWCAPSGDPLPLPLDPRTLMTATL